MLLSSLLTVPLIGTIIVSSIDSYKKSSVVYTKTIALVTSVINLIISLVMFILFNNSTNQFQFVQEHYNVQSIWYLFRSRWYINIFYIINNNNNAYSIII